MEGGRGRGGEAGGPRGFELGVHVKTKRWPEEEGHGGGEGVARRRQDGVAAAWFCGGWRRMQGDEDEAKGTG